MNTPITNITERFAQIYIPVKAFLFYRHVQDKDDVYIEQFNCTPAGRLINAHPLSEREIGQLAELFKRHQNGREKYLKCDALLPDNLLYLNPASETAIWYTPCQTNTLYFAKSLPVTSHPVSPPMLIWKATSTDLFLFAASQPEKPTAATRLYYAPFYNLHEDGRVCMGTVKVNMNGCKNINDFMEAWHGYFFNSKFSHLIGEHYPTSTPLPELYRKLQTHKMPFPETELISMQSTLKNILP